MMRSGFAGAPHHFGSRTIVTDFEKQIWNDFWNIANNEARAKELVDLLETLARLAEPEVKPCDLTTLVEDYERQKKQIEESKLEPEIRDTLLCNLRLAFTGRLQQHLEQP